MFRSLPATEVKNRLGRVLREVMKSGGPIYVERDGKPVAVILSVSEYERRRKGIPLSGKRKSTLESAFGMWRDRTDIGERWVDEGRSRWESDWSK